MSEKPFRWHSGIPIRLMRVELFRSLYAFKRQNRDEIVFGVVPKGGYRGSGNMLKALLVKHRWKQQQAARMLRVSQPALCKYMTGKRTMPLRLALDIERLNTGKSFDTSWQPKHEAERIFQCRKGTHVALMRIEVLGKVYGFYYRKDDEVVFKLVANDEYRDGKLLKEVRAKNRWSQQDLAEVLEVSQSMVAKYESGDRIPSGRAAVAVSQLLRGMTLEEIKELRALRKKWGM
jgi:transcriptional regulator with XRE-family HTH domain